MATYVNDLRLKEIATGDEAGTWGTSTNTNLELIAEAFSFGTEAITTNADTHTTTIADGSTDPGRSLFLKYTGTLDSTCTITIGPNTVSKLWFIENATSGSQSIIISQGSGANITIANGQVKAIYSDGAGSGAAMVDAFQDLSVPDLFVDDDLTVGDDLVFSSDSAVITFGADGDTTLTHTDGSGLTLNSTNKIMFNDASQFIQGSSATVLALGATDEIDLTATAIDVNGTMDVSGAITSSAGATITVADNSDNLTLTSTDADANVGPNLRMYRNSGSPADSDILGVIDFEGRNDNSQDVVYAQILSQANDVSDGSEDGSYYVNTMLAGTITNRINVVPSEIVFNEESKDLDFRVESDANTHALFVEGSSGNVGIGTSSPVRNVSIFGSASAVMSFHNSTTGSTISDGFFVGNDANQAYLYNYEATPIVFATSNTERARLDSSGNLLVGSTSLSWTDTDGLRFFKGGAIISTLSGGPPAYFNRRTNDGNIIVLAKDGTTVGSIGSSDGDLAIGTGDCGIRFNDAANAVIPFNITTNAQVDNTLDLGFPTLRWNDAFITNGVTSGSDRNLKQDIEALSDAEQRVAVAAKGLLRKFRWKDAVAEKGDDARIHVGIIAQDLRAAFEAEGLDAARYGMWCSDTWTNDDGSEQTRLSVRYSELLAFIISAI